MKMIKAGIIGLGVGYQHIAGYESHSDCKVVSVCDFSELKLKDVKKNHPEIKATKNADDILNDPSIDVVSIASFDNYHHEQISKALKNGKHVFVEKPFVIHESEAENIRQILNENPQLKLSSNLILRKYPRFTALKKLIDDEKFGELYYLEADYLYGRIHKITGGWRSEIPVYSVVHGGGVHVVDLLLWLSGQKVIEVSAFGNKFPTKNTAFKGNDMVAALLKFQNGTIAKVTANFGCVFPHFHGVSVYGTKATFKNSRSAGFLFDQRGEASEIKPKKIKTPYPGAAKGDHLYQFIESILGKKSDVAGIEEVFNAMSVCFAIEKSVQTNQVVKVNYY